MIPTADKINKFDVVQIIKAKTEDDYDTKTMKVEKILEILF